MRYYLCDDVTFTDYSRGDVIIKDRREIPVEEVRFEIDKKSSELLDEIACRPEVFGDNGEIQTYRIFDLNIAAIVQNNFDLTKIKKVKIPK